MSALFLMSSGLAKAASLRDNQPREVDQKHFVVHSEDSQAAEGSLRLCPAGSPSVFVYSLWSLVQALAPTRVTWRTWATLTWWRATRGGWASTRSGGPLGTTGPWKTSAPSLTGNWTSALSTQAGNCKYPGAVIWASGPVTTQSLRLLYTCQTP